MLTNQGALEVPLVHIDTATAPVREVPADGDAIFQFGPFPEGAASAGKSEGSQGLSSSGCLVWQLDGAAPTQLLLQEVSVNEERRDGVVRLAFGAPLLPAVSCTETQQETRLAVVTADGVLHKLVCSTQAPASLARQMQAPGAVTSVPLAPHFQRAGSPTTLLEVGGVICIGTAEGNVVCLPAGASDPAAVFQLAPATSLSKMFGGMFGRTATQAVRLLQALRFMDNCLLCSIDDIGHMRLWDLPTRKLVHEGGLLSPDTAAGLVPALARLTAEPLDASTSILLVYFQPRGGDSSPESGIVSLFEIFLEQRGEGAYKAILDYGSSLPSSIHRLCDLALENLSLHTVGVWLLYDDVAGDRHLSCVPLSLKSGHADGETRVHLLEDQILEGCSAGPLQLEQEIWQAIESRLGEAGASGGQAPAPVALGAAFADAVLAPGRLSRPALHAALAQLGCTAPQGEVLQGNLTDLKQQLPRWVAAAASGGGAAGGSGASLAKWSALLQAYAAAWRQQHLPLALLQLPPQGDSQAVLIARRGGLFTAVRLAVAAEEAVLHERLTAEWQQAEAEEAEEAAMVLQAAAVVFQAAGGGQLARLLWACIQQGSDLQASVLPVLVASLAAGAPAALTLPAPGAAGHSRLGLAGGGGADGAASLHGQWRASCRKLPLQLARLCGTSSTSFAEAMATTLKVLGAGYHDTSRVRSSLPTLAKPMRTAALSTLTQVAWAQLQVLLQLALLLRYVLWSQTLAHWSLTPEESHQLEAQLLPQALELLQAAAVAYWSSVTPAAEPAVEGGASLDPAQMVVSLRIGDGPAAGGPPQRRTRMSQAQPQDSNVASLLLSTFAATSHAHVVRDVGDLQRVSLLFAQRLLCLGPSPHPTPGATAARRLQQGLGQVGAPLAPADLAADVSAALLRGRHSAQLAALQRLVPGGSQDMRLLFFKACSLAHQISLAAAPGEQQRLEEESCSLFFRVAAVFTQGDAFPGQAAAVDRCVQQMLADQAQAAMTLAGATGGASSGPQAAELAYYEALMTMYERQGRYAAAARFALAAARQVAAVMPQPEQVLLRQQAQSRLWANVFNCMMESGRYEEAYVALLSIEASDVQLDCLHRLVAGLCGAKGGVELLCRLPFAHNLMLVKGMRQTWVPMLEEVVAGLQRRASFSDLRASPQPYKILADFHIARNNYQAAAGAMLAYARRLVQECPEEPPMLLQAEHALATAVSCLSLLERQHAWLEDVASVNGGGSGGLCGEADPQHPPPVLTLAALQREYAIVRGHAALAAAMPGGQQGHATFALGGGAAGSEQLRGGDAEDVFAQLLALGLHDAAFQLAEAAFVGSQLTRALERAFASLTASCVKQQLALGRAASSAAASSAAEALLSAGRGGDDDMETGEAGAGAAANGYTVAAAAGGRHSRGGGASTVADWRHLKDWLLRHEAGEHRFRLRLVILESILRAEPAFMLPPWLMAAFKAGAPGSADLAGGLRVLMKHARLADAATLAVQHLQHALHSVPSVGMARTSQVYFPAALLDQLLVLLGGAGLAQERQQVAELLQRVRSAALSQTDIVQQLFSR